MHFSTSGHPQQGGVYTTNRHEITVLLPNPFADLKLQRYLNGEYVDDMVCGKIKFSQNPMTLKCDLDLEFNKNCSKGSGDIEWT